MEWKPTWRQEEINYDGIGRISNHTQRICIWNNLNAEKLRIRFSNRWASEPLIFENVTIGIQKGKSCSAEQLLDVTANGEKRIVIAPGQELISDEICLPVCAGNWMAVSTYIKDVQNPCGAIGFWNPTLLYVMDAEGCCAHQGNFASAAQEGFFPSFYRKLPQTPQIVYGIHGIDAYTESDVKVIAAFGDSITHIGNWLSPFTKTIYQRFPGKVSILNCGIAGNCLCMDHPTGDQLPCGGKLFGTAGLRRFEDSVYRDGRIDIVILLIGTNDLLYPFVMPVKVKEIDVPQLIDGYERIIRVAKKHGSILAQGLIPPFQTRDTPESRKPFTRRNEINQWILSESKADFIIPFCDAVCDDTKERLRPECDSGDGIHPSLIGGQLMAEMAERCFSECFDHQLNRLL